MRETTLIVGDVKHEDGSDGRASCCLKNRIIRSGLYERSEEERERHLEKVGQEENMKQLTDIVISY